MNELLRIWVERLQDDITGFADPKTPVTLQEDGRRVSISWVQRSRQRRETFQLTADDDFRWEKSAPKATPCSYRDFLCSEQMADLEQLATAITTIFQKEPNYVPTTGEIEDTKPDESDRILAQRVHSALGSSNGQTQLLFVKGDAGAGKTTLLREVVAEQAARYLRGESKYLFLLINAQGRALSNLRDAMAGELHDLRAGFTRDAVPALVRRGVLVPIIDGFDELLGAAGYGDAFGSLRQFVIELDGHGVMVVSARSSFYDVEFLSKSAASSKEEWFSIVPITLNPWGEDQLFRYLARIRGTEVLTDADRKALKKLSLSDRSLLGKPFFASRLPGYLDSEDGSEPGSLLQFLVEAYVKRESEKIVDKDGKPLVPVEGHRRLFAETAEYMWSNESRRLNTQDLRFLAEVTAEESKLSSDASAQFVTKITSYAGFKTADGATEREFTFEHEVYFDYFLSSALRGKLERGNLLPQLLNRGVLPETVVATLVADDSIAKLCVASVKNLAEDGVLHENLRRNVGQLLAASFRELRQLGDVAVGPASFVNVSFGECELKDVSFLRCSFIGTRLEAARLENCSLEDGRIERIRVSSATRLNLRGLMPGGNVMSVVDMEQGETFSPPEITDLLRKLGAPLPPAPVVRPAYSTKGTAVVGVLRKLARVYQRTTVACTEDDTLPKIFKDPEWKTLERLLRDHQIVKAETRPTSGNNKVFLRPLVSMPDLMRHEMEMILPVGFVGNFWTAIRAL